MTLAKSDDPRHNLAPSRCQGTGLPSSNQIKLAALLMLRCVGSSATPVLITIKTKGFTPKTKATRYFARVAGQRLEKIIHE
jgi:hypothetical protein